MADQHHIPLDESQRADDPQQDEARDDGTHEVRPDVAYKRTVFVNLVYIGPAGAPDRGWTLVDAGVSSASARAIRHAAEDRFGSASRPAAIVLTHGHFDHIGAAEELSKEWECPIYAHPLEIPYLDGSSGYPPPDPSVGGGVTAWSSFTFPRGPVNLGSWLQALPGDGTVPSLPEWRWIAAPGHSVGQIALWRESDRTLIAADAFVTTNQESLYAALTQELVLQGPPAYFTGDWQKAAETVRTLANLDPETVITGHGRAMHGAAMRTKLHELADRFEEIAVPKDGKFVHHPARVEDGSAYV